MINAPQQQIPGVYHRRVGDILVTAISDGFLDGTVESMRNINPDEARQILREARLAVNNGAFVQARLLADRVRDIILDGFDMSLGTGLGKMKGKIFRIGHLGHFNDLMLCGTLCGVEMGLHRAGIPHRGGGVAAALELLGTLDAA